MLAYLRLKHELCPQCGTAEADWIDPLTRKYLDNPKWEASTMRCFGCAELEAERDAIPPRERGVRVVLVPWQEEDEDEPEEGGMLV